MKFKNICAVLWAALVLMAVSCAPRYESVKGDPLNARIYTLSNGLKVYMTVNKDQPRIQTYIAVHAGGKDDPADNTGLAHYLEHMMFKGTQQFGTQDYDAEAPLLRQIDSLYEVYRTITDPAERTAFYAIIDSVSYEASRFGIANEYDKLMSIIGSDGSNAYTSNDVTCYVEDIPSNQLDNWARIQADRFMNCVFRGFHTELEAVYEEKNMSLVEDGEKALDAIDSMLFVNHPYGTQTVIGTQEHLKNPSLMAIRRQKDTYYVPNNVAICLSGDLDPVKTLRIIEKYFGEWKPNPELPERTIAPEEPITAPRCKEILGNEAEFVMMGWRTPGLGSIESEISNIVGSILYNGQAGLVDLDLLQHQAILDAGVFPYNRSDWGLFLAEGFPKDGQSLEEVRDLILGQVARLRSGDFPESLVEAAKANYKLRAMKRLEENSSRADIFVDSFINGTSWETEVTRLDRIAAITKDDVVAWANQYLGENSYAVVFKRLGEDTSIRKIDAPAITPILTNRDCQSDFLRSIADNEPAPIEPVFVDYQRDMQIDDMNGAAELLYKKNEKNDITALTIRFNIGSNDDPRLDMASDYISYLGSASRSADEIASELYGLACYWHLRIDGNTSVLYISGLDENIAAALGIVEDLLRNPVADEDILAELKRDQLRSRADSKMSQRACNSALQFYATYGADAVRNTTLTNAQLTALTSDELLQCISDLLRIRPTILYYGPSSMADASAMIASAHPMEGLVAREKTHLMSLPTPTPEVILAHYASRQFNYAQFSDRGETLDISQDPYIELFNEYYGGGMNAIVFQEMRESRALAYSAGAWLSDPAFIGDTYFFRARIASQNDKLQKAVEGFAEIIEDMPEAPENLEIAKASILGRLRTTRVLGEDVLYSFLNDRELGLSETRDKAIFEQVGNLTMDDLRATHQRWIAGRTYHYAILGDTTDLDLAFLSTLGTVKRVSLEEIFGY